VIVLKFGGTSVADAAAIDRAAVIVRGRLTRRPVVVVSALAGATNALLAMAEQATRGQLLVALRGVQALRDRHLNEADALLGDTAEGSEAVAEMGATFDELAHLLEALSILGHATPRSLDAIASVGEQLSTHLVVAAFCGRGVPAQLVDAREVMITDDNYTRAEPLTEQIAAAARERILPVLRDRRVPVIAGFIGATEGGVTTTIGRNGSDYSASLFGAAMRAQAIEIWTDVDGMLTADPRVVEGARLIPEIRFDEAAELASFGAKLHPNTIAPAVRLGIPVFVLNSRRPEGKGTRITFDAPRRPVSAVVSKRGTTMVKINSPRMLFASGFLHTVFEIFARHRTSVDVVATSEVSISVTVDDPARLDELMVDLRRAGDVSIERNRGVVAVVGAGLNESGASMSRALASLEGCHLHMLSLSATGINLTLVVDDDDVTPLVRRLHAAFFGGADEGAA